MSAIILPLCRPILLIYLSCHVMTAPHNGAMLQILKWTGKSIGMTTDSPAEST